MEKGSGATVTEGFIHMGGAGLRHTNNVRSSFCAGARCVSGARARQKGDRCAFEFAAFASLKLPSISCPQLTGIAIGFVNHRRAGNGVAGCCVNDASAHRCVLQSTGGGLIGVGFTL